MSNRVFPMGRKARSLILTLTAALALSSAPAWAASVQEVVVVFKTHFDIGYTDMASNVVQRYRTSMIDDALKVVDQNRGLSPEQQFVWTLPGWPLSKIIGDWPGQNAERQQKIKAAFKDGRFVVHALPFTTHTELLEPEDLVRGLQYASRVSRDNGLPLPRDAKMTDVPSHAWLMPTLLRNAGVDFLHLGCNAASSSPKVPLLFWWEGPDGSRLLTMYTAESYGTGLKAPESWPYQTWLALIHTGDNHGPPTPAEVKNLLADAATQLPGVKVRIGRLSDFADAILAEKANIPVVRADMPDTWIHGPMCNPQGAALARHIRPGMVSAEALGTLLGAWGAPVANDRDTLPRAFEQSLLYGEHTWGGALYWVTGYGADTKWGYGDIWRTERAAGRFQKLEAAWAEHTSYIENAAALLEPLRQRQLETLARSVNVGGERLVVFNPLPWNRTGLVQMPGPAANWPALKPADGGAQVPGAKLGNDVVFSATVPALGYATFQKAAPPKTSDPENSVQNELQNRWFKLTVDPARGSVVSLVDKASNRELVDPTAPVGFGQFLYERFASNQVAAYVQAYTKIDADWAVNELGKPSLPPASAEPYRAATPRNCAVTVQESAAASVIALSAQPGNGIPFGVTTRYILYQDQPILDIEIVLDQKPADAWPEAGWLCLPFKIDKPQFRVGRQASVIDPATDIVRGANRDMFAVNTGVAMFEPGGRGVGFCPIDSPLVSLSEPGCWKYSLDSVPTRPVAFVNLFNNQWSTNFRLWNEGTIRSRVRVWEFDHYVPHESLVRPALEARYPLEAIRVEASAGSLPPTQSGLELDRKDVLVTAFGPNPDGPGTVLRLWEYAGKSGPCRVRLPKAFAQATLQPVDLRGQKLGAAFKPASGTITVELKAFAPASFQLVP